MVAIGVRTRPAVWQTLCRGRGR